MRTRLFIARVGTAETFIGTDTIRLQAGNTSHERGYILFTNQSEGYRASSYFPGNWSTVRRVTQGIGLSENQGALVQVSTRRGKASIAVPGPSPLHEAAGLTRDAGDPLYVTVLKTEAAPATLSM